MHFHSLLLYSLKRGRGKLKMKQCNELIKLYSSLKPKKIREIAVINTVARRRRMTIFVLTADENVVVSWKVFIIVEIRKFYLVLLPQITNTQGQFIVSQTGPAWEVELNSKSKMYRTWFTVDAPPLSIGVYQVRKSERVGLLTGQNFANEMGLTVIV